MTMTKEHIQRKDNIYLKQNFEKIEIFKKKNGKGSCITDSFITFQKLRKNGAIRVRGCIGNSTNCFNVSGLKHVVHYWVECKGKVFDICDYQQVIASIKDYYDEWEIYGIEKTETGVFNHNYKVGEDYICGKDSSNFLKKYILPPSIIETKINEDDIEILQITWK